LELDSVHASPATNKEGTGRRPLPPKFLVFALGGTNEPPVTRQDPVKLPNRKHNYNLARASFAAADREQLPSVAPS
jgi:hypothetical protein